MEYDHIYKYVYMHSIQFDTFKMYLIFLILSCRLPFKSLGAIRCVFLTEVFYAHHLFDQK